MHTSPSAPDPSWHLVLCILVGFAVVFPLFWCFIVWMLSWVSGWRRLSRRYASGSRPVAGERHAGVTGMVGLVSYRHVLTLHFAGDGFFLEPLVLFKVGHPRLFIPWSEVTRRGSFAVLWWRAARLGVGESVVATLSLPADLVERYAPV
jgi:hypothetical protein